MQNKNYLIVGGSYGIGLEVVKTLLKQNASVYVLARTNENLPVTANIPRIADINSKGLSRSGLRRYITALDIVSSGFEI